MQKYYQNLYYLKKTRQKLCVYPKGLKVKVTRKPHEIQSMFLQAAWKNNLYYLLKSNAFGKIRKMS